MIVDAHRDVGATHDDEMQCRRANFPALGRGIALFPLVARPLSSTANYTSRAIIVESKHPGLSTESMR